MMLMPALCVALCGATAAAPWTRLGAPVVACPAQSTPAERVFVASNDSCTDFYICSHGVAYRLVCPSGLFFNPASDQCDYPANVNCSEPVPATTTTETTATTNNDNSTAATAVTSRTAARSAAPSGQLFLSQLQLQLQPQAAATCPQMDGQYPVFLPNPDDCSEYYMCSHGTAYLRHCPGDLLFNKYSWTCDFSWNVDCVANATAGYVL